MITQKNIFYKSYHEIFPFLLLVSFSCNKMPDRDRPTEVSLNDSIGTKINQGDTLSGELYELYEAAYSEPSVICLRKALNLFLKDSTSFIADSVLLQEFDIKSKIKGNGLGAFPEEYYTSKFVVLWINKIPGEGDLLGILFKEKPDRIFEALMIKVDDKEFLLGAFKEKHVSKKKLQKWLHVMQRYLADDKPDI